ncbi:MAG: tRNA guanosine(15) transglycosylase TgtA [Nitrososphaeria archaeon]
MPTFEVRKTDLAARLGYLKTKSGVVETPAVLPVIHPFNQIVKPIEMERMGYNALMTNSYLILKKSKAIGRTFEVHDLLNYKKTVMTDSGAYQLLEYGEVDTTPEEIINFETNIGSDIGVILDTPTGLTRNKKRAEETVSKTIDAAIRSIPLFKDKNILWTGPIQGGVFYDLIEKSAKEMSKLNFDVYALGSPTQVMEQYDLEQLLYMILAAKRNLPLDKPLHLFGAGHPLTLPIAVALGCDLFDSASYILYAKRGAYMTESGTKYLDDLKYLTCECEVCSKYFVGELKNSKDRVRLLALHNLHVLSREIKSIKQAIYEGRLWEYVAAKSRAHPRAWTAFKHFSKIKEYLGEGTPLFKSCGLYLCSTPDEHRPEVENAYKRLIRNIKINKKSLVVYFSKTNDHTFLYNLRNTFEKEVGMNSEEIQFCVAPLPIAIAPIEVCDIYPFSQYDISLPLDKEMEKMSIRKFKQFLSKYKFKKVLLIDHSNDKYKQIINWFTKEKTIQAKKVVTDRQTERILKEFTSL